MGVILTYDNKAYYGVKWLKKWLIGLFCRL